LGELWKGIFKSEGDVSPKEKPLGSSSAQTCPNPSTTIFRSIAAHTATPHISLSPVLRNSQQLKPKHDQFPFRFDPLRGSEC
jgi:hypothetical protein